jgi:UDP-3-O-[3-hydroxymyristoyl] glucosamine N-acyltransferase
MPTVSELAALVGGEVFSGSGDAVIEGPAALESAGPGEISFFAHPRYAADLRTTRATAVLVPRDFAGETPAVCIRVDDPSAAFTRITREFLREPAPPPAGVHPSAVVHSGAQIAPDASIGGQAVVMPGAVIGPRSVVMAGGYIGAGARIGAACLLHPHAVVGHGCLLGDRVILHSGAVVGSDGFGYDTQDGRHTKIAQSGIVVVEDDVEIGANTTIDRARFGRTVIGEGTKIDNLVMIAHNVVIGKHCIVCAQVGIAGSARIGNHVILAGQAGLVGHIRIGDGAIVGAQTGVSNDIEPGARVVGSPPRPIGDWKRSIVRVDRLAELYDRVKKLEQRAG